MAYPELIRRTREAALLASCGALLGWDERTLLPPAGATFRGEQMGLLAKLGHAMTTAPEVGDCLEVLENARLTPEESANVREIRRGYDRAKKLPARLVEELATVVIGSQQAWQDARQTNDFAGFLPWLTRIVNLKREELQAVGYVDHPYDALLDEYEPNATTAEVRTLFAELADALGPILSQITASSRRPDATILHRDFPIDQQRHFGAAAAAAIGFDFAAGRLDVTTHPFCSGIGPGDCRITTRYNAKFFNEAFFGILHEAGHGIYEQNLPAQHFGTPLGSYCSLGIHESQSRLWENQVGRSKPFWEHFLPRARQTFPTALANIALDDFMFAINVVEPSYIRVEADEITYNLHIILRFELEQALLTGDLLPADVPGAWNERFHKLFGLQVPDFKQGCLQDIHWSMGGLGYFPTYTLGNLYAAQFMAQAKADLTGLDDDFRTGRFERLKDWLTTNIHAAGRQYPARELCERVTGQTLSVTPFVSYLREKFLPLYGA